MGKHEEENKQLARDMIDALTRADVDWVRKYYADDFSIWVTGSLPFSGTNDKAGAIEGMPAVLDLFPKGLTFTIKAMTAEGDRVAIEATSAGTTFRGDEYRQEYHFLMRARDGKIVEWKEYMDTEHARKVLVGE
ncbi:MAG TPA: nuclear transport factor 2 family protein [Myxococcota bacterium]|nr:nuclear transport factor 2 family protein [Myxococcota bacterium]